MKHGVLAVLLLFASTVRADTVFSLTSLTQAGGVFDATFSNGVTFSFTLSTPSAVLMWAGPGLNPQTPSYGSDTFDVAIVNHLNGQFYSASGEGGYNNGSGWFFEPAPIDPNDPGYQQQNDFDSWWGTQTFDLPQASFTINAPEGSPINAPEPSPWILLLMGLLPVCLLATRARLCVKRNP